VKKIQSLSIDAFDYSLPEDRIAKYPLVKRSDSKLLHYQNGEIKHFAFPDIVHLFHPGDYWVINNTKVIPARLHFQKSTGGVIEIFCLEPLNMDYTSALTQTKSGTWRCFVGGAKKWKDGVLSKIYVLNGVENQFHALCLEKEENSFVIQFNWTGGQFSEVLDACGELPIPPYLNRETEPEDYDRYQTLFAEWEGSVAAPTASLHFDHEIIDRLKSRGVQQGFLTLHVGAGTFKPVNAQNIGLHEMHAEYFEVSLDFIKTWIEKIKKQERTIVVGTTALRTLESVYWLGNERAKPDEAGLFHLGQWIPYEEKLSYSLIENLNWLYQIATEKNLSSIAGTTQILIGPGYEIRTADVLITNFHQPKSTLLLLVHAVIGDDWEKVYQTALDEGYRFLSYGDSSWLNTKKASKI
jgi:S-adenosylmethionine:tRNA ribosyltransferase-isomerase